MYIRSFAMRVAKWGNSLAVRLPASVVEELALKEGDDLTMRVSENGRELNVSRRLTAQQIIASLREFRGRLPSDFKFDRDEANER
jgi:antitoxin MazE